MGQKKPLEPKHVWSIRVRLEIARSWRDLVIFNLAIDSKLRAMTATIEAFRPALWVHGHVHNSCDYRVGETRIICNPHGYGPENPDFDGAFTVAIE